MIYKHRRSGVSQFQVTTQKFNKREKIQGKPSTNYSNYMYWIKGDLTNSRKAHGWIRMNTKQVTYIHQVVYTFQHVWDSVTFIMHVLKHFFLKARIWFQTYSRRQVMLGFPVVVIQARKFCIFKYNFVFTFNNIAHVHVCNHNLLSLMTIKCNKVYAKTPQNALTQKLVRFTKN